MKSLEPLEKYYSINQSSAIYTMANILKMIS